MVEAALEAACVRNSLVAQTSMRAVQATIRSGLEFGLRQPRVRMFMKADSVSTKADTVEASWQPAH